MFADLVDGGNSISGNNKQVIFKCRKTGSVNLKFRRKTNEKNY